HWMAADNSCKAKGLKQGLEERRALVGHFRPILTIKRQQREEPTGTEPNDSKGLTCGKALRVIAERGTFNLWFQSSSL
ncbi:MAG: hypothetical protein ACREMY_32080, partial [bacterium]